MLRYRVGGWGGDTGFKLMACTKLLSFAEIVQGRDASVRVTDDGMLDVVDLVMVVTGKNCNDSNEALRDLKPSLFDKENILTREKRRYVTLKNAITLIMVLPGKMAKELRNQFTKIVEDYIRQNLSGDECNLEQLAGFKRRRETLELLKLEEEIRGMTQTRIIAASMEIERIRDPSRSNLDDRTRLMIQDALQNSIITTAQGQSASGAAGSGLMIANGPSPNAPISISSVAAKLGYKPSSNDAKRIGGDLRKRYIKVHNKPPGKHDQLCDGRVTSVNSYTEQDRPLVEEALHAYFRVGESDEDDDSCGVKAT